MVERARRFGVSLPSELSLRFDSLISELGYSSRSKAIDDAVREFIVQKKVLGDSDVVGTISYLYEHHVGEVNKKLVEYQHGFEKNIRSMMHCHMSHNECIEVLIVCGTKNEVQKLYGGLSAIRGVRNCKLSILSSDEEKQH
jgi:CopG family transcriptional regulator, nickel-responsive regulator